MTHYLAWPLHSIIYSWPHLLSQKTIFFAPELFNTSPARQSPLTAPLNAIVPWNWKWAFSSGHSILTPYNSTKYHLNANGFEISSFQPDLSQICILTVYLTMPLGSLTWSQLHIQNGFLSFLSQIFNCIKYVNDLTTHLVD